MQLLWFPFLPEGESSSVNPQWNLGKGERKTKLLLKKEKKPSAFFFFSPFFFLMIEWRWSLPHNIDKVTTSFHYKPSIESDPYQTLPSQKSGCLKFHRQQFRPESPLLAYLLRCVKRKGGGKQRKYAEGSKFLPVKESFTLPYVPCCAVSTVWCSQIQSSKFIFFTVK